MAAAKALSLSIVVIASGSLLMSSRPPMEELVEVVNLTHPLTRVGYTTLMLCNLNDLLQFRLRFRLRKVSVPVPDPDNI
jgi:hypothetical protein